MGIYWINETNIPGIEYEPEKLNNILTLLEQADPEGQNSELVQTTLNKLRMYTRVYFTIEEQIMTRYEYPEMDAHLAEHARLADRVNQMCSQEPTILELLTFLTEWQENHTRTTDKKLGSFITRGASIRITQYA